MAINDSKPLPPLSEQDIARFWDKVDKTPGQGPTGECWPWKAAMRSYGAFWLAGRHRSACRIALFLYCGKDPYPLLACHSCDWHPCCRGEHLFAGTHGDNSADMVKKDRSVRGERHAMAKLTDAQVKELRDLYGPQRKRHAQKVGRISQVELAIRFGIDRHTLRSIIQRKTWDHLV